MQGWLYKKPMESLTFLSNTTKRGQVHPLNLRPDKHSWAGSFVFVLFFLPLFHRHWNLLHRPVHIFIFLLHVYPWLPLGDISFFSCLKSINGSSGTRQTAQRVMASLLCNLQEEEEGSLAWGSRETNGLVQWVLKTNETFSARGLSIGCLSLSKLYPGVCFLACKVRILKISVS